MASSTPIDSQSPVEAKVRLFRSLFRGREDVYARRFESRKTGRHGYADVLLTLSDLGVATSICDERCGGRPLAATFQGRLRPEQQAAIEVRW